jgi:hypothetical protein
VAWEGCRIGAVAEWEVEWPVLGLCRIGIGGGQSSCDGREVKVMAVDQVTEVICQPTVGPFMTRLSQINRNDGAMVVRRALNYHRDFHAHRHHHHRRRRSDRSNSHTGKRDLSRKRAFSYH